ncbi:MAG: glycosyltransferase [Candidatus Omnitrophota bacterium]
MLSKQAKVLYITYLGVLEAIPQSQVLPYLFGISKEVEIHLLSFEKKQLIKNMPDEFRQIKDILNEKKIAWHRLPYHKYPLVLSSFFDIFIGSIISLFLIVRYKISIVHARSNIPIAIGFILKLFSALTRDRLRFKLLYDRRGIMAEDHTEHSGWKRGGLLYCLAVWFEKKAIHRSNAITVLTERMNRHLRETLNLEKDILIKTIPCCIDLEKFNYDNNGNVKLRDSSGLRGKFVFVYSGSLGTYNLLGEMFDFFRLAVSMIPDAHFLILTQNKDIVVNMLAKRQDIDSQRIILKHIPPDKVPVFLSLADVGLIFRRDSSTAIASCPTKLGEYLACGLPVISISKIGDVDEMLKSHKIGVILNSYEASEYQEAIGRLLFLLKEKDDLRKRCRNFSENYFSLERGINAYLDIYSNLLEKR